MLDHLHRTHTSLPFPLSTSQLNNSILPFSRCGLALVSDRLHSFPTRRYRHRLGVNSAVLLMMLLCHPHQNARMLAAGTTLQYFKISAHRVGMSTDWPRSLPPSRIRWDHLGLHLVHHHTLPRVRVHRFLLRPGQAVSILVSLHHHRHKAKTGCNRRRNLDPDRTALLLCPMVCRHPSG